MSYSAAVGRLWATTRLLLSALFRIAEPITEIQSLEEELFDIQQFLRELQAAALDNAQILLDSDDLFNGLQSDLEDLQHVIEHASEAWMQHPSTPERLKQLIRTIPTYMVFLNANLAALSKNGEESFSLEASSLEGAQSLKQVLSALPITPAVSTVDPPRPRIKSSEELDAGTQQEYSQIVWDRLSAGAHRLKRNGISTEKRLLLIAGWICESRRGLERCTKPPLDLSVDDYKHIALQAFLNSLKAAAVLLESGTSTGITMLVSKELELLLLRQIEKFRREIFDLPDFYLISEHSFNFELAQPQHAWKGKEAVYTSSSKVFTPPPSSSDLSLMSRKQSEVWNTPELGSEAGSNITLFADAAKKHHHRTSTLHSEESVEQTENENSARQSPSLSKWNEKEIVPAVAAHDDSNEMIPATEDRQPNSSQNPNGMFANFSFDQRRDQPAIKNHEATNIMPYSPDSVGDVSGLMVTLKEQETICKKVTDVELPSNVYEELFHESIGTGPSEPFDKDILCLMRELRKGARDVFISSKVRLFRHIESHELHVYTELESQPTLKIDHQEYNSSTELVPLAPEQAIDINFFRVGLIRGEHFSKAFKEQS
ncbi:hypothetical protein E8E14_012125 [Neopestalotiopsis sp. 37M]|nr:hypothetical protein E8E14_012125 [Neopestalotiopsis sp. 37M]